MSSILLNIRLHSEDNKQRLGTMTVYKDGKFIQAFATLERNYLDNIRNRSGIKPLVYDVSHHDSPKHPHTFIVNDVDSRTGILIHSGNYYDHSAGCILLGLAFSDINADGYIDVIHSKDAMKLLNRVCKIDDKITLVYT